MPTMAHPESGRPSVQPSSASAETVVAADTNSLDGQRRLSSALASKPAGLKRNGISASCQVGFSWERPNRIPSAATIA